MTKTNAPQLQLSLDFAEQPVRQLQVAPRATGQEALRRTAKSLHAEIDAKSSQAPPEQVPSAGSRGAFDSPRSPRGACHRRGCCGSGYWAFALSRAR
jgi:hypothetical protein